MMSASSRNPKRRKVATTMGERRPARRGVERPWTTVTMSSAAVARGVEFEVVVDDGDDLSCVATSARRQRGWGAAPGNRVAELEN